MYNSYLPSLNITDYQDYMIQKYPKYYITLFLDHPDAPKIIKKMNQIVIPSRKYKNNQNYLVRLTGIKQVLRLALKGYSFHSVPKDYRVLDVLGGEGMLAKVLRYLTNNPSDQTIFTSDVTSHSVHQALKNNLPAIRELAQGLFLRDESFDAVIIANGSHRIAKQDRLMMFREAMRVLKPNGILLFHGFENNSPVTKWFTEVVDNYSSTNQQRDHFTQPEIQNCFEQSGFEKIKLQPLYDPLTTTGATAKQARNRLVDYVVDTYSLDKLKPQSDKVLSLMDNCFRYQDSQTEEAKPTWKKAFSTYQTKTGYCAELPRLALVGIGRKPR